MARSYADHKGDADAAVRVPDVTWQAVDATPAGVKGGAFGVAEFKGRLAGHPYHYLAVVVHDETTETWYVLDLLRRRLASTFGFVVESGPRRSWQAVRDAFVGEWRKDVEVVRRNVAVKSYARDVFDDPVTSEAKLRRVDFVAVPGAGNNLGKLDPDFDQDTYLYDLSGRGSFTVENIRLSSRARAVWTYGGNVISDIDAETVIIHPGRLTLAVTVTSQDNSNSNVYRFRVAQSN